VSAGDRRRAETVVDAVEQLSESNADFTTVAATALHARGVLDRNPAALLAASSSHAHPWARASAAEDAGTIETSRRRYDRAGDLVQWACATYRDSGAAFDVNRTERTLDKLHTGALQRGPSPPESGWWGLTETEREVSGLVALGLTNAQIAERMFVSRYTVDFHLRRIFRKLNVRTRVEVARLAIEHEPPKAS